MEKGSPPQDAVKKRLGFEVHDHLAIHDDGTRFTVRFGKQVRRGRGVEVHAEKRMEVQGIRSRGPGT